MGAIYILWLRELKRYVRSRVQIVVSLGQPCLYLLALGFGLGPVFRQAGHVSYLQFMAPGVIGITLAFTRIFCTVIVKAPGGKATLEKTTVWLPGAIVPK